MSNTGNNIGYLLNKYDFEDIKDLTNAKNEIKCKRVHPISKEEEWKPKILEELALMKLGLLECQFDEGEIDDLLEDIATT